MRVRVITTLTICLALFFPNTIYAANPKAGATCGKQGLTQIFSGKKYTCIKSGKKLIWNKGVLLSNLAKPTPSNSATAFPEPKSIKVDWSKTYSTDDGYFQLFNNPCQREENIASQWVDLQNAYFKYSNCIWPINVGKYVLGKKRPQTDFTNKNSLPIDECKISEPENSRSLRGFYSKWPKERQEWVKSHLMLGKSTRIQIVPIQTNDSAEPKNSPEQDYGRFTDFLIDWVLHSADNGASIKVNYPKQYIRFNGNIKDYGIYHEAGDNSPGHVKFNKDLVSQVDSQIDFTDINLAIIVTPAGTDMSLLQQGSIGELVTKEGRVAVSTTEFPYTLENFGSIRFKNLMLPYWWLHELLHSISFDDHYGDTLQNVNSEYGLGWWSLMTPGGGDLTAWEKWVMELISDSQVNCLAPLTSSISWLAPSSVKTTEKKLSVIPLSASKALVLESIRPSGLYYKLPKNSLGVMIYEINLDIQSHGLGMKLVLPTNRDPNKGPFFLGEAPLRAGESVVTNGHRITVLESGNFGDVVKVEKA